MFFNRKKNQDKPEADDVKSEKSGFFSFFSRSTPAEKKAPDEAPPQPVPTDAPELTVEVTAESRLPAEPEVPAVEPSTPEITAREAEPAKAPNVTTATEPAPASPQEHTVPASDPDRIPVKTDAVAEKPKAQGWFARIKSGLARTSSQFAEGLGNLLLGKKTIDDDLLEELETQLLVADVGIDATTEIIDQLTDSVARKQLADSDALYQALQIKLEAMLTPVEKPLVVDTSKQPYVILVVGVNGVGKTTTIGKLAYQLRQEGKSVMLAAGDTFRAAAVEQLQVWGERNDIHVVAQHTGADSASVVYDAIASAKAKKLDVVICDTAGRLHNKAHLMEELAKVRRVITKLDGTAPHEVLLVLDAGTGQNAVSQAENFKAAAGVTGLALTKLDGTAKGGVIFALSQKFGIPVRFIGVGEGIEDLQTFRAKPFVDALFNRTSNH